MVSGSKKVLVMGNGMLGDVVFRYLNEQGADVYGTTRYFGARKDNVLYFDALDQSEFTGFHSFADTLKDLNLDYVINCIGIIKPRINVSNPYSIAETIQINSLFPHELASYSQELGFKVIHASTDCVFNGDGVVGYTEGDLPDAYDLYGRSKAMGESPFAMNLRCSIIGPAKSGNGSLWEWYLSQNDTVNGFVNHYWNGVTTLEYSKIIYKIIQEDLWKPGIQHVPGEYTTKNKILEYIQEVYADVRPCATVKLMTAPETKYMILDTIDREWISNFEISPLGRQIEEIVAWTKN